MVQKAVVILSGGMDSSTLLYHLIDKGYQCYAITYNYGQRHNKEIEAAKMIVRHAGVMEHKIIDLSSITGILKSALVDKSIDIPEGHYAAETMKQTIVPNRNLLFLTLAHAWAQSLEADVIAYAAHAGDHFIYPDCRKVFIDSARVTLFLSSEKSIQILAPFWKWMKWDIVSEGIKLNVPYEKTWTCYVGGDRPCLKCGTCIERTEAFVKTNAEDSLLTNDEWEKAKQYLEKVKD